VKNSEFYQQVLGLQCPWKVEQVELDHATQRVVVHVLGISHVAWLKLGVAGGKLNKYKSAGGGDRTHGVCPKGNRF
jgi:hypothetical protein